MSCQCRPVLTFTPLIRNYTDVTVTPFCHDQGMGTTIAALSSEIQSEADAYAYFERLRWGSTPICAHCDSENVYLIVPENGISRKTRTGAASERRVWRCRDCKKQFSVLTNTVMHGTRIPVRTWAMVTFEMCASKNGVAAREVERKYGMNPRSAWFLLHRIREAMRSDGLAAPFRGTVVADETWIGGRDGNRHANKKVHHSDEMKAIVLTLVSSETGEARSQVVADVSGFTLRKAIARVADMSNVTLHTDGHTGYTFIDYEFAGHESVNHVAGEYVRGLVSTNKCENFFSQLKRSLDGTHHHVSHEHLHRYLGEFDFRYSTRDLSDAGRMELLAQQVAGRLTYKTTKRAA